MKTLARVDIWGSIRDHTIDDDAHPFSFEAKLGVETYRALRELAPIESERIILLNMHSEVRNSNPVWVILSKEEALKLSGWLAAVVQAYDNDEDFTAGAVPALVII